MYILFSILFSVCDTNHYGVLCSDVCSDRHCDETNGKSTCNGITGQCGNGCDPGWTGVDCTQSKTIITLRYNILVIFKCLFVRSFVR